MRFGRWLPFCVALWAAAAATAQTIVDPDGKEGELDWQLANENVVLTFTGGALTLPSGLVFIGTKEDEEFLVLERDSGKVRHFTSRVEAASPALDLAVDTCGDRGLLGIALHPHFERGVPAVDAEDPEHDWVYVSYHSGAVDTCADGAAVFHVDRYTWNGTALVNPVSMYTKDLTAGETTRVGGAIATSLELQLVVPITEIPRLYILIGSLGRDGQLQNNADGPGPDDTSVLLRLDDDGTTPQDNPFDDPDTNAPETKDRYFAYGVGDPRGMVTDPVSQTPWFAEYSDEGKPDEINLLLPANNGGYSDYQGFIDERNIPDNDDDDYPLFDLAMTDEQDPADEEPVSTFLLPRFSFEVESIEPTAVAFGGTEVGPQHREDLFVGTQDGKLLRFHVEPFRAGFELTGVLADTIAQKEVIDDDGDDVDEGREADALTDIVIGEGYDPISELEAGVDGSIYVVQESGAIDRVFFDARRDLAAVGLKGPKKISLSAKKPVVSKSLRVTVVNNGEVPERIDNHTELVAFLGVEITPVGPASCLTPEFDAVDPKYVLPPYSYPIGIKAEGGKLTIEVSVEWECDNGDLPAPVAGVPDFETSMHLNPLAIGVPDEDPANDDFGPIVTDIIEK